MWEYLFTTIDTIGCYRHDWNDPWGNVNDLGRQGWELVAVWPIEGSEAIGIFKRAIEAEKCEN